MIFRHLLRIKKIETLIETIRIYSQDIGMELEKCPMLIIKKEKQQEKYNRQIKKRQNT